MCLFVSPHKAWTKGTEQQQSTHTHTLKVNIRIYAKMQKKQNEQRVSPCPCHRCKYEFPMNYTQYPHIFLQSLPQTRTQHSYKNTHTHMDTTRIPTPTDRKVNKTKKNKPQPIYVYLIPASSSVIVTDGRPSHQWIYNMCVCNFSSKNSRSAKR